MAPPQASRETQRAGGAVKGEGRRVGPAGERELSRHRGLEWMGGHMSTPQGGESSQPWDAGQHTGDPEQQGQSSTPGQGGRPGQSGTPAFGGVPAQGGREEQWDDTERQYGLPAESEQQFGYPSETVTAPQGAGPMQG